MISRSQVLSLAALNAAVGAQGTQFLKTFRVVFDTGCAGVPFPGCRSFGYHLFDLSQSLGGS